MTTPVTTVTYAATIDEVNGEPQTLTNTAVISAATIQLVSRSAVLRVNWHGLYLPVVLR